MANEALVERAEVESEEDDLSTLSPKRTYAAFGAMCVIVLTEALDGTSIAVTLPVSDQSTDHPEM